jgi:N-acetyl-anhydromuramyl-L-alanine amidase AmpD
MARYPNAIWRGANDEDFSRAVISPRFIVIHVEQGSEAGTSSWFHNPSSQVSAHFGVAKSGQVEQFVDTKYEAYAEMAYNGVGISIEHEGFSGQRLTDQQIDADARLLLWINQTHGVPLKWQINALHRGGVVGHGELGVAGGDHLDCPGIPIKDDVRNLLNKLQRPAFRVTFTKGK